MIQVTSQVFVCGGTILGNLTSWFIALQKMETLPSGQPLGFLIICAYLLLY